MTFSLKMTYPLRRNNLTIKCLCTLKLLKLLKSYQDIYSWRKSDVSQVEKVLDEAKNFKNNYINAPSDSYEVITFSLTTATSSHLAMCLFLSWLIHIRNFKVIQGLNILFVATEVSAFLQVIAYLTLFLPGANLPYTLKTH